MKIIGIDPGVYIGGGVSCAPIHTRDLEKTAQTSQGHELYVWWKKTSHLLTVFKRSDLCNLHPTKTFCPPPGPFRLFFTSSLVYLFLPVTMYGILSDRFVR